MASHLFVTILSILSESFVKQWEDRIINVHPSLIPSFCGKGFYGLKVHEAALEYGVKFEYRDFRPYFRAGQEKARELEMYIQKYCGCVFSEEERYIKAKKIIP